MSRSLSFSYHLGDEALPVDVEFEASWSPPEYYGDSSGWIIEEITILTQAAPYTDVTDQATKEEMATIHERAVQVAEDAAQPDPDLDRD